MLIRLPSCFGILDVLDDFPRLGVEGGIPVAGTTIFDPKRIERPHRDPARTITFDEQQALASGNERLVGSEYALERREVSLTQGEHDEHGDGDKWHRGVPSYHPHPEDTTPPGAIRLLGTWPLVSLRSSLR